MSKNSPHPVDVHVGNRVRLRRMMMGISQEKLAELAGQITFQQIQKYEKGTNRISASRLVAIADALDCQVTYFFEDLPGAASGPAGEIGSTVNRVIGFAASGEGVRLNKAFAGIRNPLMRRTLIDFAQAVAGVGEAAPEVALQEAHGGA
jgi:transcriptional regulator with XRE-family HTH domain